MSSSVTKIIAKVERTWADPEGVGCKGPDHFLGIPQVTITDTDPPWEAIGPTEVRALPRGSEFCNLFPVRAVPYGIGNHFYHIR